MLGENYYVYKKEVDWSLLHEGVSIPVTIQVVFQHSINQFLSRGQSKDIFLVIEGKTYKAELKNQKFDERKYPNRTDIMQIRYSSQSEILSMSMIQIALLYLNMKGSILKEGIT